MRLNIDYEGIVAAFRAWYKDELENPDEFALCDDSRQSAEDQAKTFIHYLKVAGYL